MHELSIAMSIIEIASEEAARCNARVSAIHLKLGQLSGVVKDALLLSYEIACAGSPLEGSRLVIEEAPVVVFCSACQAERTLASIQNFCCPVCDAHTPEVRQGRELTITALEIDGG